MTVVSVVGLINSNEIRCVQTGVDAWDCDPGETPDGRYASEFWATDDAGNIAYRLAILYVYDGRCVRIEWVDDKFLLTFVSSDCVIAPRTWQNASKFTWKTISKKTWLGIETTFIDFIISLGYEPDEFDISFMDYLDFVLKLDYEPDGFDVSVVKCVSVD